MIASRASKAVEGDVDSFDDGGVVVAAVVVGDEEVSLCVTTTAKLQLPIFPEFRRGSKNGGIPDSGRNHHIPAIFRQDSGIKTDVRTYELLV